MALAFSVDPATGVIRPPVTVFNGGKRNRRKTRRGKKVKRSGASVKRRMTRRR